MNFQSGDIVRVAGLPHSGWRDRRGIIVQVIDQPGSEAVGQECHVKFPDGRLCWFLAGHLVKSIPENAVRYFRAEVLERWKHLNPDDVPHLHGDREELVRFLQDACLCTIRRAEAEADEFLIEFQSRLQKATGITSTAGNRVAAD
jgi:hypothetical protein